MGIESLSVLAQIATGIATLAVALFLASQLRLQHKDSVITMRAGATNTLTALAEHHIADSEFTNIFLRGIRDEDLNEEERHRYNMFLNMYFVQCQQMWIYDKSSEDTWWWFWAMLQTGPGVRKWYREIGSQLLPEELQDWIDRKMLDAALVD